MNTANADLIPPPLRRGDGWPWSFAVGIPTSHLQNPHISVTMPSFNKGDYIEEAIRSVLSQAYAEKDVAVFDCNSTDQTVSVLRHYEGCLDFLEIAADNGQAHAINKGWVRASGDLLAWLNADDYYEPNAFSLVAEAAQKHPEAVVFAGMCREIDGNGRENGVKDMAGYDLKALLLGKQMGQPSVFIRADAIRKYGGLDENLHWALDTELFIRILSHYGDDAVVAIPHVLATSRAYEQTKTWQEPNRIMDERRQILRQFFASPDGKDFRHLEQGALAHTFLKQAQYLLRINRLSAVRCALRGLFRSRLILFRSYLRILLRALWPKPIR